MGILKDLFFGNGFNIDDVESVVIIEQTQNYKNKSKAGLLFGENLFNPNVLFMDGNSEPAGSTYTFIVTFKNGEKKIIKERSGTTMCDELLQKALDPASLEENDNQQVKETNITQPQPPTRAPELKKNQLPQGEYKIGVDIPAGRFDFHLVWGDGEISLYDSKGKENGKLIFYEFMGNGPIRKLDCVNLECQEGWYLCVEGNVIVNISRSKSIEIDL